LEELAVNTQSPLARLIQARIQQLGIDAQALGFRLGYRNAAKGAGRVNALCDGYLVNRKSKAALARLPEALELPSEVVEQAVTATEQLILILEQMRQREEDHRVARDAEAAEWRRSFRPHAIMYTERTIPSQITFCGLTGGVERWLTIRLDESLPPITFIQQSLAALPDKLQPGRDGHPYVPFFANALGFIINYSPEYALRCSLSGMPLEILPRAYKPEEVNLSIGRRVISPRAAARLFSFD
jgi:hypothetical protein